MKITDRIWLGLLSLIATIVLGDMETAEAPVPVRCASSARGLRPNASSALVTLLLLLLAPALMRAQSAVADPLAVRAVSRIAGSIDSSAPVMLRGNHHPRARAEFDAGAIDPALPLDGIVLVLKPSAEQEAALAALLEQQQNPASPQYHQWLTPEQYAEHYGVSEQDVARIVAWLQSRGLRVDEVAASRRTLRFSGTVAQVEQAFAVTMHHYRVGGEMHLANANDPSIPSALEPVVGGVLSLHDFRSRPQHSGLRSASAEFSFGSGHFVTPGDLAVIYDVHPLYTQQINGSGESVAVVARSNIVPSDISTFRSTFGLPAAAPQVIVNGSDPGTSNFDELTEATLDAEYAAALAPSAAVKFVTSASTAASDGTYLSAQYIVNQNLAPVMTMSFGACEADLGTGGNAFINALWQQAASQGITVLVSAGDSGAAGCDDPSESTALRARGINGLCSSPYSLCVGGTEFNDTANPSQYWSGSNASSGVSALSYIPEVVWNESSPGLWASGGGKSTVYSKPAWQAGPGVPADGQRDVPDLSLNAAGHDGYMIVMKGSEYVVGGTSAASPALAGIMALLAQSTGAWLGAPHAQLYAMASSNNGRAAFHDITSGNNSVPGLTGYTATAGYDMASGLGSVDASALVAHWGGAQSNAPRLQLSLAQNTLTAAIPSTPAAIAVNVSGSGLTSPVALSATGLPSGMTASFSSASVANSGSSNLQLSIGSKVPAGTYSINVVGSSGKLKATSVLNVKVVVPVTPALTLTAASSRLSIAAGASGTIVLSSSGNSGITSAVSFTASGLPKGVTASFSPASIAAPGTGNSTVKFTASSSATLGAANVKLTASGGGVTVTVPLLLTVTPAPSFTFASASAANAATVAAGSKVALKFTSAAQYGFNAAIALSASGLPPGVTAQFSPSSIQAGQGTTLTLVAAKSISACSATVTVTATGGGRSVPVPITLTVTSH